jgi:hypothetical protein
MGHSETGTFGATTLKCRICGCRLDAAEGDDPERGVCASCGRRPEARRLGQPASAGVGNGAAPAREFTPAELSLIQRVHAVMPLPQLLAILNERLVADLGPDAAPYTLEQLQANVSGWSVPGALGPNDWAATRKFLASARRQGILDRIDESVINAFAVVFQLAPKQVLLLKDVVLGG